MNLAEKLTLINERTNKILHDMPTEYVSAINLVARTHALAKRDGAGYDYLSGMAGALRVMIAVYLDLMTAPADVVTGITSNVIDHWIEWTREHD